MDFGRKELLDCLVRRIERQFAGGAKDLVEPSLVIGLFGEWGSGKSYLLKQAEQRFDPKSYTPQKTDGSDMVILPVRFNPWRFESEEHLIVPLLLTIKMELERLQRSAEAGTVQQLSTGIKGVLAQAARRL